MPWPKGKPQSPEHRAKTGRALMKDRPGYIAIHVWLAHHFPKKGVCEECGRERQPGERAFHYASLNGHNYTRKREDYAELCPACHTVLDSS